VFCSVVWYSDRPAASIIEPRRVTGLIHDNTRIRSSLILLSGLHQLKPTEPMALWNMVVTLYLFLFLFYYTVVFALSVFTTAFIGRTLRERGFRVSIVLLVLVTWTRILMLSSQALGRWIAAPLHLELQRQRDPTNFVEARPAETREDYWTTVISPNTTVPPLHDYL
jgi:hypothetical protein